MFRWLRTGWVVGVWILAGAGCGDEAREPVEIQFAGLVGESPFECGGEYAGMGVTGADFRAGDFRFFVSDVRLLTADGGEVPVHLDDEALLQHDGVALLDFEDGTAACSFGNPEMKDRIVGTARPGEYTGIRFVLGVPDDLNHLDPLRQPSPLNISAMHWGWARGYIFMRTEGRTLLDEEEVQPWVVHTGSAACETDAEGNPLGCMHENRPEVELTGFDPTEGRIVADLAALLAGANLEEVSGEVSGCEGHHTDPDCLPIFEAMGVAVDGGEAPTQTFFRPE